MSYTDPRGPIRQIDEVAHEQETDEHGQTISRVRLRLSCGHYVWPASHFAYRVSERFNCMACKPVYEQEG